MYTYNEQTDEIVVSVVSKTSVRTSNSLIELTIADDAGNEYVIGGTAEHPFYVPAIEKYVALGDLTKGTILKTSDGTLAVVENLRSLTGSFEVYNFTVTRTHNYFVASIDGGPMTLVHNASNYNKDVTAKPRTEDDFLADAMNFIGDEYDELSSGIFYNRPTGRMVRFTDRDILGQHGPIGPHGHLMFYHPGRSPKKKNIIRNIHIPFKGGMGSL